MSSYAFPERPVVYVACTTNPLTGEHEHHYPSPGPIGLEFARPTPAHALTPGAIAAVERMAARRDLDITADVGNPRIVPHSGKPPAGLVRIERLAQAAGFTTKRYESVTGHALQGRRDDIGFRATWQHGKTTGATWHERAERWALVDDPRPVKMSKRDGVGLKGYRSEGMGRVRLKLVATPYGLPINITELEKRLTS